MLEIRERQIEDILATQLDETRNILGVSDNLVLLNRQKRLPSGGILDLLFCSSTNLHLCELKAVVSKVEFCDQVLGYKSEIEFLQKKQQMIHLPVKTYLLCPEFLTHHRDYCHSHGVIPIEFSPFELLKNFYYKVKAITKFITLKPGNHGVWNLHLLHPILYNIHPSISQNDLSHKAGLSLSSTSSYLRLSTELGLTQRKPFIQLTDLGKLYVQKREKNKPLDYLSDEQVEILKEYILHQPLDSPAIYGIYAVIESIFILSKNFYPVPLQQGITLFASLSGKEHQWDKKAKHDTFRMYSNYAIDLGLLARIEQNYYLTPAGIKFILLLELNKSILFVNSL